MVQLAIFDIILIYLLNNQYQYQSLRHYAVFVDHQQLTKLCWSTSNRHLCIASQKMANSILFSKQCHMLTSVTTSILLGKVSFEHLKFMYVSVYK